MRCSVLQCTTMCCSVLQCVAVCCSQLQPVAACCSVLRFSALRRRYVCVYSEVLEDMGGWISGWVVGGWLGE